MMSVEFLVANSEDSENWIRGGIRMTGTRTLIMLCLIILLLPFSAAASRTNLSVGDRVHVFGDVEIAQNWRVTGNAVSVFGNVTVYGEVDQNAVSIFGTVRVGSNAVVGQSAVAIFGRVITESGGQIRGSRISVLGGDGFNVGRIGIPSFRNLVVFDAGRRLAGLVFALVSATLVALLFPSGLMRIRSGIVDEPALSALIGFVAYVVAAPLILISIITIIGIPLGLALVFLVWAGRLLGYTAIALLIGERILGDRSQEQNPVAPVLVGILLLAIVTAVPLGGFLVSLGVSLVALGGALLGRFGVDRKVA